MTWAPCSLAKAMDVFHVITVNQFAYCIDGFCRVGFVAISDDVEHIGIVADLDATGGVDLLGGEVNGIGFRESDGEMRDKFDAAIASMKADGSLNALIAKWEVGAAF